MNVETITMEPELARQMLEEYRGQVGHAAAGEYAAIRTALEVTAKGRAIVNLRQSILEAGLDELEDLGPHT